MATVQVALNETQRETLQAPCDTSLSGPVATDTHDAVERVHGRAASQLTSPSRSRVRWATL